jgi:TP901 family phage tail tape measure protein
MARKFQLEGRLSLNNSRFLRGMSKATAAARKFGKRIASISFRGIKAGALAATAAATAFGISAARTIAGFGMEMSKVKALTGANAEEFEELTKRAREMGATTSFSAKEAAAGMAFLAQAGFKTNEILASSEDLLNLAAAGGMDLAEAMDIASNIMKPFNMSASESGRVADVLAKTASSTNTNVNQLGEAFKKVAPISQQLGISFEETSAAIGTLGNAGIQASDAGTALKNIMARLVKPTTEVEAGLEALGLTAEDVNPATQSLSSVFFKFQKAAAQVNDRAKVAAAGVGIFGLRANAAGGILMNSSREIWNMKKQLDAANGSAKEMAKTMLDNLGGDAKILKSVFQEVTLAIGEGGLTSVLRQATQWMTQLLQQFGQSGKAAAFGKAIREAVDFMTGAFADPDKLMKVFAAGLKWAAASWAQAMYQDIITTVEIFREGISKVSGAWGKDMFEKIKGFGNLFLAGLKVVLLVFANGIMQTGINFVALLTSGIEKAVDMMMLGLSKIPKLAEMLGIKGYQSVLTFGQMYEGNRNRMTNKMQELTGLNDKITSAMAEVDKALDQTGTQKAMDGVRKWFEGIADGSTKKKAKEEFIKAYKELSEFGKKERERKAKEMEAAAESKEQKQAIKQAANVLRAAPSGPKVGDRNRFGFRYEGVSALTGKAKLLGPATKLGGASMADRGLQRSKTGGYGGWRFGDEKRRKEAIEEAKKKSEEEKLQIEANKYLKEQNDILKQSLLPA